MFLLHGVALFSPVGLQTTEISGKNDQSRNPMPHRVAVDAKAFRQSHFGGQARAFLIMPVRDFAAQAIRNRAPDRSLCHEIFMGIF